MENWKGHGEKKDRREQSERKELERGAGWKKSFSIPSTEPWVKAALGQVVSQGRVARGGREGNRGTGGKMDSVKDGEARVATRSCHGGSWHHRHSPEPGSTLPHRPRTRQAQPDELQLGTCKGQRKRRVQGKQSKRRGCAPGLGSAVPPRQGYCFSRSKCLR